MTGRWRLLFGLGIILVLLSLLVYVLRRTHVELTPSSENAFTLTTAFPRTTCHKTLSPEFPFMHFICAPEPTDEFGRSLDDSGAYPP